MKKYSLSGQTALITGASSGIGKACAEHLASQGVNVVITARRFDRLSDLAKTLAQQFGVRVTPVKLDVQNNDDVIAMTQKLAKESIEIDILVNNAGLALSRDKINEGNVNHWNTMIDTNIKGLLYVTRALLPRMIERNRGHIINLGSVAGHDCYVAGNIYSATKHAVRAISKSLRLDLLETAIRVTEIAPGAVHTEFSEVRFGDKIKAQQLYEGFSPLCADDIADAVTYCASRPPHVNIAELVIFPQAQASVSHIFRGQPAPSIFDTQVTRS